MAETRPRIFCVGMNKTGTTSLMHALGALGVGEVAPRGRRLVRLAVRILRHYDYEPALREPGPHRIYKDRPWNVWDMYRRLDQRFPGSRFILSVREPEAWWRSVERWLAVTKPWMAELYRLHLRAPDLSKEAFLRGYEQHNRDVRGYFAGRDEFLELDVTAGLGWQPLCAFLGCAAPSSPFPHTNRQSYTEDDRVLHASRQGSRLRRAVLKIVQRVLPQNVPCAGCAKGRTLSVRGSWEARRLPVLPVDELLLRLDRWRVRRQPSHHPPPRWRRTSPLPRPSLGVVCAFSNPRADPRLTAGFRRFLAMLHASGLPILSVECALGEQPFQLGPDDGQLLQVRAPDLLVQRERLWNLGIRRLLAQGVEAVAWLEPGFHCTDVAAWLAQAAEVLRQAPVCQLFDQVEFPDGHRLPGAVAAYQAHDQRLLAGTRAGLVPAGLPGLAWAARAEILREVQLFDRAVDGSGPALQYHGSYAYSPAWLREAWALTDAVLPRCARCIRRPAAPEYTWDYICWAQRWARAVERRVGFVSQRLRLDNATSSVPASTNACLQRQHFAPRRDLELTADGTWRWSAASPALRRQIAGLLCQN